MLPTFFLGNQAGLSSYKYTGAVIAGEREKAAKSRSWEGQKEMQEVTKQAGKKACGRGGDK